MLLKRGAAQRDIATRHSNEYVVLFVGPSSRAESTYRDSAVQLHSSARVGARGGIMGNDTSHLMNILVCGDPNINSYLV